MLLGGLMLLADATSQNVPRQRCIVYGGLLKNGPFSDDDLWNKWHYVAPEHWTH